MLTNPPIKGEKLGLLPPPTPIATVPDGCPIEVLPSDKSKLTLGLTTVLGLLLTLPKSRAVASPSVLLKPPPIS